VALELIHMDLRHAYWNPPDQDSGEWIVPRPPLNITGVATAVAATKLQTV